MKINFFPDDMVLDTTKSSLETTGEDNVMSKLSEIEKTVKQTQKDMQEFINFSRANSLAQSELQSVRSQASSGPSSLTTNDSRRLLEDQVIQQALHEPEVDFQPDTSKKLIVIIQSRFSERDFQLWKLTSDGKLINKAKNHD